jgi:hypothetical protein
VYRLPINLLINFRVSPKTIEQGQTFTVFASFVNSGTDTAWSANAVIMIAEGFHVVSPNPTLLGDVKPNDRGNCSFTVTASEDTRPGHYGLSLNINYEEHHWYWPVPKKHGYSTHIGVDVEESKKKRTVRILLQEVKSALDGLDLSIGSLETAGGDVSELKLEHERLSTTYEQNTDLFESRVFDNIINNCRELLSQIQTLQSSCSSNLEKLRIYSLNELTKAKEAINEATWAKVNSLSETKEFLKDANKNYSEERYTDAAKFAQAAVLSIPKTPLKARLRNIWIRIKQSKKRIGIIFIIVGLAGITWLIKLFLEGEVSFLFVLPPLISLLIGMGLSLSKK